MSNHQCNENCKRFSGYNDNLTYSEKADYERLRIELPIEQYKEWTNIFVRSLVISYLNGNSVDTCIIFQNKTNLDNLDFLRLIFTSCFFIKKIGSIKKLCSYSSKNFVSLIFKKFLKFCSNLIYIYFLKDLLQSETL